MYLGSKKAFCDSKNLLVNWAHPFVNASEVIPYGVTQFFIHNDAMSFTVVLDVGSAIINFE